MHNTHTHIHTHTHTHLPCSHSMKCNTVPHPKETRARPEEVNLFKQQNSDYLIDYLTHSALSERKKKSLIGRNLCTCVIRESEERRQGGGGERERSSGLSQSVRDFFPLRLFCFM